MAREERHPKRPKVAGASHDRLSAVEAVAASTRTCTVDSSMLKRVSPGQSCSRTVCVSARALFILFALFRVGTPKSRRVQQIRTLWNSGTPAGTYNRALEQSSNGAQHMFRILEFGSVAGRMSTTTLGKAPGPIEAPPDQERRILTHGSLSFRRGGAPRSSYSVYAGASQKPRWEDKPGAHATPTSVTSMDSKICRTSAMSKTPGVDMCVMRGVLATLLAENSTQLWPNPTRLWQSSKMSTATQTKSSPAANPATQ